MARRLTSRAGGRSSGGWVPGVPVTMSVTRPGAQARATVGHPGAVPRATGRWRAPTIGRLAGRRRSGPLATVGRVRLPRRATLHTAGSRRAAPVRLVLLAVLVGA